MYQGNGFSLVVHAEAWVPGFLLSISDSAIGSVCDLGQITDIMIIIYYSSMPQFSSVTCHTGDAEPS